MNKVVFNNDGIGITLLYKYREMIGLEVNINGLKRHSPELIKIIEEFGPECSINDLKIKEIKGNKYKIVKYEDCRYCAEGPDYEEVITPEDDDWISID